MVMVIMRNGIDIAAIIAKQSHRHLELSRHLERTQSRRRHRVSQRIREPSAVVAPPQRTRHLRDPPCSLRLRELEPSPPCSRAPAAVAFPAPPAAVVHRREQKLLDELKELGHKIKHHEDNVNFLKSQKNELDASILDTQVAIGMHHIASSSEEENGDPAHVDSKEETIRHILKYKNSAAALLYQMASEAQASDHFLIKDVVGIVATLGKVDDANLSRLLSKYLGLETMLAMVCKSYEGVKSLESCSKDGSINKGLGLHAFAASAGSPLDGPFTVICVENLRPYTGALVDGDHQKRLDLITPKLINGEIPSGFLGYAVNMIIIDNVNLYSVSETGHSLRETLFYNLFSHLQVYESRKDMQNALPLISDGAISLDGGLIRSPGVSCLGQNQGDIDVKFPCVSKNLNLPVNYYNIKNQLKEAKWKNSRVSEDLEREQQLLDHVRCSSLFVLLLISLVQTSLAIMNPPHICNPSACGNIHNISFPFRLKHDPKHCGYSDYELECENNVTTILYLNSQKYKVKVINYHNFTIRLVDVYMNSSCPFPNHFANPEDCYPYGVRSIRSRTLHEAACPIHLMSCPYPLKNSSLFTEFANYCDKDNNASNSSDSAEHTYVHVGDMIASDVGYMCRTELIGLTSLKFKYLKNLSVSEINDSLIYGFELYWSKYLRDDSYLSHLYLKWGENHF
ncbi:hypothetical protein ACS0TY_000040 [Phlomoides rotata]